MTVHKSSHKRSINDLPVGVRLGFGFVILLTLTAVVIGISFAASEDAVDRISSTEEVRQPTALAASRAQAELLRMFGDMRAYLAFGEPSFLEAYRQSEATFDAELMELRRMSRNLDEANQSKLEDLEGLFTEWKSYIPELIALREDQIIREPAYGILSTNGAERIGTILIDMDRLIDLQSQREPTPQNAQLLVELADLKSSFEGMYSGLRGYVTTRNLIYRFFEYEVNRDINEEAFRRLSNRQALLTPEQQELFDQVDQNREVFLETIVPEIFAIMESEEWRQDLALFGTEGVRITNSMQEELGDIVNSQQNILEVDLSTSRASLGLAREQTILIGMVAIGIGIVLAFVTTRNIVRPVQELTRTANQIGGGDLDARAHISSKDEVGVLAQTFNTMANQIQHSLIEIRREKKRADDLLNVVIPIGIALANETDFDRLLERMLVEAQIFCNADAGILYLLKENRLHYEIVRNTSRNIAVGGKTGVNSTYEPIPMTVNENAMGNNIAVYVAHHDQTVNWTDEDTTFATPTLFDQPEAPYTIQSVLTLPLCNQGTTQGVLQLINAQTDEGTIAPFDENLQQMMQSFSALAVAALEAYIRESELKSTIQELRIEIDEVKKRKQVDEITDSDVFRDIQDKVGELRARRNKQRRRGSS